MSDVNMQASLPVSSLLRKAQRHVKAEEFAKAAILYREVLSKCPKNKKAIQGDSNSKSERMQASLSKYPKNSSVKKTPERK